MDHLLRRGASVPPLQNITRTKARKSYTDFPQFRGSLPCTKRSIERHRYLKRVFLCSHCWSVDSIDLNADVMPSGSFAEEDVESTIFCCTSFDAIGILMDFRSSRVMYFPDDSLRARSTNMEDLKNAWT